MADVGNFDTIDDTEFKSRYPQGTFDKMYRVKAKYRSDLRKASGFAKDEEGKIKFPLKMNGMWSGSIIADNASFPTAKDPSREQGELSPELFAFPVQVGLKTKITAKSSKSTWNAGGIAADRLEDAAEEMASFINKVYCGSNRARLAIVESDGSSTFVAAKPLGVTLLAEGMRLEAYTAHTSGSVRDSFSNHKITAIDEDTRTVTYVGASDTTDDRTLVAGDSIYISGTYARSPVSMPDIVDDGTNLGTIFGKSRTTYPKLKATVQGNGGTLRNLSEQIMLEAMTATPRKTGKKITKIISNDGQWRKYLEFVAPDRRWNGTTSGSPNYVLGGGEQSAAVVCFDANCTIEVDRDAQPRSMFFLAWDTFFLYEPMPLDWIDEGSSLWNLIPTEGGHKAGLIAYMGSVENQGCLMPRASVRIDDLKDPLCGDV